MKRNQSLVRRERRPSGMGIRSIIGGVALMVASLPDIKRYTKISRM